MPKGAAELHNRAMNRARLNTMKMERGCADCGYKGHPAALQWDHLPGTTKCFGIGRAPGRSWVIILEEVAKCEVVCANCHAIRTAERGYTGGRAMHAAARRLLPGERKAGMPSPLKNKAQPAKRAAS